MLEVALADPVRPGTNQRADVVGSSWLLLLPELRHRRAALLGAVDPATRRAVAAVTEELVDPAEPPDASASLVVVGPGADPDAARAWLAAGGAVHHLAGAPVTATGEAAGVELVPASLPPDAAATAGPTLLAVPFRPRDPAAERRALAVAGRVVARASRRLGRPVGHLPGPERHGVVPVPSPSRPVPGPAPVLWRTDAEPVDRPPRWLVAMAADAGLDVAGHRVRFLPGGDYWAQKAVFLLHPPGAEEPDLAVKVGRDARFAARLQTERAALEVLARRPGLVAVVPTVAFAAETGAVSVLAQRALAGASLADRLEPGPDCPAVRRAGEALLDLAAAPGPPPTVAPAEAAAALAGIVDRFAVAQPDAEVLRAELDRSVAAVARSADPFPVVFHHGDAGVWNLLDDAGRIGVLDWENAEEGGVPLWDLFYLHQTRASRLATVAGRRPGPRQFAADLLADTPHRRLLTEEVRRWAARLELDPGLVEPLFRLCWGHHAAKEAGRTPPGRARRKGRYRGILAAVVAADPAW